MLIRDGIAEVERTRQSGRMGYRPLTRLSSPRRSEAMVGARRFERVGSRKDHRNGTYLRRLLTSLGQIDVMGRYRRRSEEVDEMMVEAYVSGVSQRKMCDVTEALLGERVGRSTVSRVAKRLDGAVEALRSAPIEGPHPYLYLDATFLDARWARKVENVSALVAYAVDPDGHRRLLVLVERADGDDPSMAPSSTHNTSGGRGRSGKDTSGRRGPGRPGRGRRSARWAAPSGPVAGEATGLCRHNVVRVIDRRRRWPSFATGRRTPDGGRTLQQSRIVFPVIALR